MKTHAYAANSAGAKLKPYTFERRAPRANDVALDILYCGVCHTDIHMARNDWGMSIFPDGSRPRDRRTRHVGRQCRQEIQGGRRRRRGLSRRQLPDLRSVPQGRRAALPQRHDADLQRPRPHHAGSDARWLLRPHRRSRRIRALHAEGSRPCARRTAAVRGHHHLLSASHLESRTRQPRRCRGTGRPGAHGREIGGGHGRGSHRAEPHAGQDKPMRSRSAPAAC